jgi:exonuclease III
MNAYAITRCWFAAAIAIIFLAFPASADDRRIDKTRLTVMTFNAEFLWDGVEPEDGQATIRFPWKGDKTLAEEHMQKVANVIIASDPDVVNLAEVENLDALNRLNDKFLAGRGYKAHFAQGKDTQTGQDMALLTRIDPSEPIKYDGRKGSSGGTNKSVSKNYTARIQVGDKKIALIGVHLLARPGDQSRRFQREAQAQAVRAMAIDQADAGWEVIVLGDFNDYDWAADSRDHLDSQPISNVLVIARAMKNHADASDDLYNVAASVPKGVRYTSHWDKNNDGLIQAPGELTSIDHMLVSANLKAAIDTVDIPHTQPHGVSDHFPIVTRFRTPTGDTPAVPAQKVRVTSLLPNPSGNETQNEAATLKNVSAEQIDLTGWKLRDLTGKTWSLNDLGTLMPGDSKTIKRNGQEMAMNNGGDTIDLIDPDGRIVQTITYPSFIDDEDEEFEVGG